MYEVVAVTPNTEMSWIFFFWVRHVNAAHVVMGKRPRMQGVV
jgi:hypothetical protein